ncbi:fringe-like protein (DUF604) [Rhynchospora pubera]|uniref:Fringe-like protein (DUF604) n=1 Tax=Rhynchospora pubera TaxID=906938 RepID=A0AAV8EJR1_9POAL|nr:fringe-like protein (DUF604) [Rhynchospora pubera]
MAVEPMKKLNSQVNTITDLINNYDRTIFKVMLSTAFILYFCYIFCFTQPTGESSENYSKSNSIVATTDLRHIVFGIASSVDSWKNRHPYIDLWWRPSQTRGVVFLDRAPTDNETWPNTSPPFQISGDTSKFKDYDHHAMPFAIRMIRVISETYNMNFTNVRWFVMADDDTVLFIENLVEVLQRYDHRKYYYIGGLSECVGQNWWHSFRMAFGGAGYAMSYPLVKDLSKMLDGCIMRYPYLYGSDHILQSCISELGGALTRLPGFHQFDLHGDISGFLSSHPPAPVLSFHHIDSLDPIFPNKTRDAALRHLMKAEKADHSRILQQTVCYNHNNNLSFSISWGYSIHVYEKLHAPGYLHMPIQTFQPWNGFGNPPFMFNVRPASDDPCEAPHVFYFKNVERTNTLDHITTNYFRNAARGLLSCANNSADSISQIVVFSPIQPFKLEEGKRECCTVTEKNSNVTEIEIRSCLDGEASEWSSISSS